MFEPKMELTEEHVADIMLRLKLLQTVDPSLLQGAVTGTVNTISALFGEVEAWAAANALQTIFHLETLARISRVEATGDGIPMEAIAELFRQEGTTVRFVAEDGAITTSDLNGYTPDLSKQAAAAMQKNMSPN